MGFGDQFLSEPALFPARLAGTPGGEHQALLDVPGGPYLVCGLSRRQRDALSKRYEERCLETTAGKASLRISTFAVGEDEFVQLDRDGRLNTFDFDYHEKSVHLAGHRMMAQVSWRPALTAALWTPLQNGVEFLETFENFFRTVVAYRLLECGGAVLHSSGVVDGEKAWIFYGHSGAGKTTIARRSLETGHRVLSDDINALYLEAGAPVVAKMPFAGELGHSNDRVGPFPLAGLHGLEQASENSWRPLSKASAVASLVSCAPFLNHDPYRLPLLMDNLEEVVATIRVGVLAFTLDGDFWALLEDSTA